MDHGRAQMNPDKRKKMQNKPLIKIDSILLCFPFSEILFFLIRVYLSASVVPISESLT